MKNLFSLGHLYPSDFLKPGDAPRCQPMELKLVMTDNGFVRLSESAPKDALWGKYWYRSSISSTMRNQLENIVDEICELYELKDGMVWTDIAGNDGYLLSKVPSNVITINIDPCDDTFKEESESRCDLVIQDYFSADVYNKSKYGHTKSNVVSVVSMFYDLEDPNGFLRDVREIMKEDGLLVIQLSYSPLMINQLEFSNICHEHLYYYSFSNLKDLLEQNGFMILDAQLNNTNAGSIRVFAMKDDADKSKFASQTHRDVSEYRMNSILCYEEEMRIDSPRVWKSFFKKVTELKKQVVNFIVTEKVKGKTIMGYGASTKFNTVAQYFKLNNELITAIADRSEAKHGLRTIGTDIPIISEEEMRRRKPDYLLIGPNHFLEEFKERELSFLKGGGKFISIMPEFKVIGI